MTDPRTMPPMLTPDLVGLLNILAEFPVEWSAARVGAIPVTGITQRYARQVSEIGADARRRGADWLHRVCELFAEILGERSRAGSPLSEGERELLEVWPYLLMWHIEKPGDVQAASALVDHLQSPVWDSPVSRGSGKILRAMFHLLERKERGHHQVEQLEESRAPGADASRSEPDGKRGGDDKVAGSGDTTRGDEGLASPAQLGAGASLGGASSEPGGGLGRETAAEAFRAATSSARVPAGPPTPPIDGGGELSLLSVHEDREGTGGPGDVSPEPALRVAALLDILAEIPLEEDAQTNCGGSRELVQRYVRLVRDLGAEGAARGDLALQKACDRFEHTRAQVQAPGACIRETERNFLEAWPMILLDYLEGPGGEQAAPGA